MLRIFNSMTSKKEPFQPIDPRKVRMYVCGITVYDYCHIGHARVMVFFDIVIRWLKHQGYDVIYARNITDIDDKIIQHSQKNNENFQNLTARFIKAMDEDLGKLGVLRPTYEPRATEAIDDIINMIKKLINKGFAYIGVGGDVYYDVSCFKDYGRLANKKLEDLRAGFRVGVEEYKVDPLDFVLWKMAKAGEPGWSSPWGVGRPGWHIECSAMSARCLGENFDIHGGGIDLKFPHHENEIAQSEAFYGHRHVNVWMHNGFVQLNQEKMSKSTGNFFTIKEVLQYYQPEVVRLFILSSHYRGPLNYGEANLDQARESLTRLYMTLRSIPIVQDVKVEVEEVWGTRFANAMNDDFNTPEALAILFELAREINRLRYKNPEAAFSLGASLRRLCNPLGLLQLTPEKFLKWSGGGQDNLTKELAVAVERIDDQQINVLVAERTAARRARNWAEADRIRISLHDSGIVLEDTVQGTIWRRRI